MNYKIEVPRSARKGDWITIKASPNTRAFTAAVYELRTKRLKEILQRK